jgi:excisionase family DNA binding protein
MARSAADAATMVIAPAGRPSRSETPSMRADLEADARLLLTVAEAAHRLGIGRSLLYELLADGRVESIHIGRLRRIPADALAAYIDRQRRDDAGPEI